MQLAPGGQESLDLLVYVEAGAGVLALAQTDQKLDDAGERVGVLKAVEVHVGVRNVP